MGPKPGPIARKGCGGIWAANSRYWKQFEGKVQEVSTSVNNSFIAAQGDADGVLSYGRAVQLIVGYYDQKGWIEGS